MKIALGTVQFGIDYGVTNSEGMVPRDEASKIITLAEKAGINTLDTASAYGESETVLGHLGVHEWHIITKLPVTTNDSIKLDEWTVDSVKGSLSRLRRADVYGILIHRPSQLFSAGGEKIYRTLQVFKSDGVISKIGVSIYSPKELEILFRHFDFDIVQAPFNIIDRRLITTGWMQKLYRNQVELHVRSIFLQGILLEKNVGAMNYFNQWPTLWAEWNRWLRAEKISSLEACVRFALSYDMISKIIVGVQSKKQLTEILVAASKGGKSAPSNLCIDSDMLLDPSCWKIKI